MSNRFNHMLMGKMVRLTAPRDEDRVDQARWSADPEYARNLDEEPMYPRPPEYFKDDKKDKVPRWEWFYFHIRTLAEDKFIGFIVLHSFAWNNGTAWLSVGIGDPDYRGKGYGTDALKTILDYAFRELNLHRVNLIVFSYNGRGIRAYEKVGFVREGVAREALYRDGQRHDVISMGLLRREYEALHKS